MARPSYVVARHGGTRYHLPHCQALDATYAAGEVDPITRTTILVRRLLPCAHCTRDGMRQVTPLALVS